MAETVTPAWGQAWGNYGPAVCWIILFLLSHYLRSMPRRMICGAGM